MDFQKTSIMFNRKVSTPLINKNDERKVVMKKGGENCQCKQNEARSQNDSVQEFLGGWGASSPGVLVSNKSRSS